MANRVKCSKIRSSTAELQPFLVFLVVISWFDCLIPSIFVWNFVSIQTFHGTFMQSFSFLLMFGLEFYTRMKRIVNDRVLELKTPTKVTQFGQSCQTVQKSTKLNAKNGKKKYFLRKNRKTTMSKKRGTIRTTLSVVSKPESHCPLAPLSQKFSS